MRTDNSSKHVLLAELSFIAKAKLLVLVANIEVDGATGKEGVGELDSIGMDREGVGSAEGSGLFPRYLRRTRTVQNVRQRLALLL